MSTCAELNESYGKSKVEIEALKLEIDLEFQKEKGERDYSRVIRTKKEVGTIVERLKEELNPIPEYFRGKEGVRLVRLEIGGKTAAEIIDELTKKNLSANGGALGILRSEDFRKSLDINLNGPGLATQVGKSKLMNFIHLTVRDLGFAETELPTVAEVYKRAKSLGLELCPPEAAPSFILKFNDELRETPFEWFYVAMEPVTVAFEGDPLSFVVTVNLASTPSLGVGGSDPNYHLDLGDRYIFAIAPTLRKASVETGT